MLSIGKLAIQLTTPLLLRKSCKRFASVARVCQRQLAFRVDIATTRQGWARDISGRDRDETETETLQLPRPWPRRMVKTIKHHKIN